MIENHMVSREDKPSLRELENKLAKLSEQIGALEAIQGLIAENDLGPDVAKATMQTLNNVLMQSFEISDELAKRSEKTDYFKMAVDLIEGREFE